MYLRAAHAEVHLPPLLALIQANPLGLITTAIPSSNHPLIQHTNIPWLLDPPTNLDDLIPSTDGTGPVKTPITGLINCKLRGHMARANPHAKALIEAVGGGNGMVDNEVTVLFTQPAAQHYMTPQWYTLTKPDTGKVVPTWNYVSVEVRGRLRVYGDSKNPETDTYLQQQVEDLTALAEGSVMAEMQRDGKGWEVSDAPSPYIEIMKKAIMGVEVLVESVVGKWKMSQELKEGDREGVLLGLRGIEGGGGRTGAVADLVETRSR